MDVAHVPAGWYRDPSARHEKRYWDGGGWSGQVIDAGVVGEDPTGLSPATAAAVAGIGFRAVGVAMWRRLLVALGGIALAIAFAYELIATVIAFGMTEITTDETWLYVWSWLYKPLEITRGTTFITQQMYVGYPPVLVGVALIAGFAFASAIYVNPYTALTKAGARMARFWASPEDKLRWSLARDTLGLSRLHLFRTSYRVWLILAEIASVALLLLSANAILGRAAMTTTGDTLAHLKIGLGPWVCLGAGIIGSICFALAFPLSRQRKVMIHADGTVDDLITG